jgi:hypothetical protein
MVTGEGAPPKSPYRIFLHMAKKKSYSIIFYLSSKKPKLFVRSKIFNIYKQFNIVRRDVSKGVATFLGDIE